MANVITLEGGDVVISASLDGGDIYPSGGSGGNLQAKSVSYTPTEVSVSDHLTPSAGYDGFSYVDVSIDGISPNYIGSAIPLRNSSDLSAAGATVTAPYGYYGASATKTIPNASTPTIDSRSVDSSGYVTVDIEIDNGGYIGTGTYEATDSVPLPTQAAQTIHPSSSDQSIASGKYLTGAQTIKGVLLTNLSAGNIKKDVVVKVGDSTDDDCVASVTGTYEGGGGTTPNDVLNSIFNRTISGDIVISKSPSDGATSDKYNAMFSACNSINSVTLNGWLTTPYNFLQNCTSVKSVSMPDATYVGTNVCDGCSNLETANFPLAETAYWSYSNHGGAFFRNCKKLTSVNMPKTKDVRDYMFQNCYLLPALELDQNGSIQQQAMSNCRVLQTLILRNTTMVTLGNVNAFQNTPFTGYGGTYSGHIYVPQSLISSYQTASNWSTLYGNYNGLFTAIEGSPYENARLDGTPLT